MYVGLSLCVPPYIGWLLLVVILQWVLIGSLIAFCIWVRKKQNNMKQNDSPRWKRFYNCALVIYLFLFIIYLLNLAIPPGNMPALVLMFITSAIMIILGNNKKHILFAICLTIIAIVLMFKEYEDGVHWKHKIDMFRQSVDTITK